MSEYAILNDTPYKLTICSRPISLCASYIRPLALVYFSQRQVVETYVKHIHMYLICNQTFRNIDV